jgi:hypothetical protein
MNGKYIVANRVPEAKIKSKKVGNLYFTGQLTVPGVPPALISGKWCRFN